LAGAFGEAAEDDFAGVAGTHAGPLNLPSGPVAATGNSIAFDEIRIDRHAEDRIAESWWIPDRYTLWQQLGLLPAPPAA
jgi:hypothetical protein